jgi:hypothetical protein
MSSIAFAFPDNSPRVAQAHPFHYCSCLPHIKVQDRWQTMNTKTVPQGGPFTTFTNLGPLTPTSFPNDCLASLWDFNTPALVANPLTYQTQGCAVKTCCPSGNFYTEAWAWMTSYYSPGVCPSQYRSCAPPPSPTALSSEEGEIIVFCCPTSKLNPNRLLAAYALLTL